MKPDKEYPEQEIDDTDLPVGTTKINVGYGVNNYIPPSVTVQGALARLLATNEERENG
jgi:hypothetical protein